MSDAQRAARPFGDAAVLAELGDLGSAQRLALALEAPSDERLAGVQDVVLGFGTVSVLFDPRRGDLEAVAAAVSDLAARAAGAAHDQRPGAPDGAGAGEAFELEVCFDGPDLAEVADRAGAEPAQVVDMLAHADLHVAFLGFSPGFAYLVGLPPALSGIPRRARPRPRVPAGSLGLGGGFAGVYPQATPGGWHLVGRTDSRLFDEHRAPYAVLRPGCRVRLRPKAEVEAPAPGPRRRRRAPVGGPALVVEDAGACTLVEDAGRRGVAGLGVPRAGAADGPALRLANRLVGNAEDAAALEITVRGPRLRARGDLHVAALGDLDRPGALSVTVDGHPAPEGHVLPVASGQVLEVRHAGAAVRAVLAVAGGLESEPLFGSRSTDLLSGLAPGPLAAADELAVGPPGRPRGRLVVPTGGAPRRLRLLAGPDLGSGAVGPGVLDWMTRTRWRTAADSNRIGTRLVADDGGADEGGADEGRPVADEGGQQGHAVVSRGMVAGSVQFPPGGELVVLGPDHATVGGYGVPAVVISADLHHLAHLAPGDVVQFEVVELGDAVAALAYLERTLDSAVGGWFPTRTG